MGGFARRDSDTARGRVPGGLRWPDGGAPKSQGRGTYYEIQISEISELIAPSLQGKEVLVKEHAVLMYGPDYLFQLAHGKDGSTPFVTHSKDTNAKHTNPTCVPDEVFLSMQPIFQIRHPGLMFPSMTRAETDTGMANGPMDPRVFIFSRLAFSRQLYEWYINTPGAPTPKVISADDIMQRPEVVKKLCEEVGLDADAIQYEWEMREAPADNKNVQRFASTIYASKGILPGYDSQSFDMEEKTKKWREEFGEEAGEFLAEKVKGAMGDYEWLMERRVTV